MLELQNHFFASALEKGTRQPRTLRGTPLLSSFFPLGLFEFFFFFSHPLSLVSYIFFVPFFYFIEKKKKKNSPLKLTSVHFLLLPSRAVVVTGKSTTLFSNCSASNVTPPSLAAGGETPKATTFARVAD
jgi:hypothetical protein